MPLGWLENLRRPGLHNASPRFQKAPAPPLGRSARAPGAAPGHAPPKGVTRREASLLRLAFVISVRRFALSFPCLPPRAAGDFRSCASSRVFRALAVALASRHAPPENSRFYASSRILKALRSGVAARLQGASPRSAEIRADSRRPLQTMKNVRATYRAPREEGRHRPGP